MARLAIRAQAGLSGRERTTADQTKVAASIHIGNRHVGTVVVQYGIPKTTIYYYPQGTGRTLLHSECDGHHESVHDIVVCPHCAHDIETM
jgi:hypothetical protein